MLQVTQNGGFMGGGDYFSLDTVLSTTGLVAYDTGTRSVQRYRGAYNNVSMTTLATNAGWNGIVPVNMRLTIDASVYVGNIFGSYALDTGTFPSGSFVLITNNGTISGYGGQGGTPYAQKVGGLGSSGGNAVLIRSGPTVQFYNNGVIAGGGGGGGAGGGGSCGECYDDPGGAGGGGAGLPAGNGGTLSGKASYVGYAGTTTAGGAGGTPGNYGSAEWNWGKPGGAGGAMGYPGIVGTISNGNVNAGGAGGLQGYAVIGYNNATWTAIGTITGPTQP